MVDVIRDEALPVIGGKQARLSTAYTDQNDEQLMAEIVKGNTEALEALYDRYSNGIFTFVMRMLRDSGAAEEVMQDVFFRAWRRASSYRANKGGVSSWIFAIARNRAIDEIRRRQRKQSQIVYGVDLRNTSSDEFNTPLEYATLQFELGLVKSALPTLKLEQRKVVMLAYFGGLTHTEIAEYLGYPLGTVKTRMRLALKRLKEYLSPRIQEMEGDGL